MTEDRHIDLEPHEWRLKGAKRVKPPKPFKKQPDAPLGKPLYYNPIFSVLAVLFAIWVVLVYAFIPHDTPRWIISITAFGPISIMLALMVLFDD